MRRCLAIALLSLLAAAAAAEEEEGVWSDDAAKHDLSGVWRSPATDVVVRKTGTGSWIAWPTELGGAVSGKSWHFQHLGGDQYQFWIILEGKATTRKLDEQRLRLTGRRDEMTLRVTLGKDEPEELPLARRLAPVPAKIGEVAVSFEPAGRMRVPPNQDVDVRLVRALQRAVKTGRAVDPDLKRLNVSATIEHHTGVSRAHGRYRRTAIDLDRVNGAAAEHWEADVEAKLEALEDGEEPDVDPRRDYARHVTAVVLPLLLEEEIDEVVCPAVLDDDTLPYLEWWIGRYGRSLPRSAPSVLGWKQKIEEMLERTRSRRHRVKDWLHVSVRPPEEERWRRKKSRSEKYDRE